MDLLNQKELGKLFKPEYWPDGNARDFFYLSATMGLSLDELDDLLWKDVDLKEKTVCVKDKRKKIRLLPINSLAAKVLAGRQKKTETVFTDTDRFAEEFYTALAKAGLKREGRNIEPSSLRASFLALLKSQGYSHEQIERVYGESG